MSRKSFLIIVGSLAMILTVVEFGLQDSKKYNRKAPLAGFPAKDSAWTAPDTSLIAHEAEAELIRYGRALIASTADFFGPYGKIAHTANGMNCQNCHLDAGTKPWGNNYGAVYSTYPKFRDRRGGIENVYQRVNDCFQRSLNGSPLDSNSREMQAILSYLKWVGKNVVKGRKPNGSGIRQLDFLNRAADPAKGKIVYEQKCVKCHGANGEGTLKPGTFTYLYPPLWGNNSYSTAAGLYRLSRFAGYVRDNMPFGASYQNRQLTDEQSWDVAAYVNAKPRPDKKFKQDWPDIALKPIDHPFGPYTDSFAEQQHKFGPFLRIQITKQRSVKKKS